MLSGVDIIRIINLPERKDRHREMMAELEAIGLATDPRVAFFPAVRPSDRGSFASIGARGCYESHLGILQEAARLKASVLILEDDCTFSEYARHFDLRDEGWDVFYGGYYATDPQNLNSSVIMGTHMMGFSAGCASELCRYLENLRFEGEHPPIDGAYVRFRRDNPAVRTRFAVPPLANQRPSRSDIADLRFYDELPILRTITGFARAARRRLR